MQIECYYRKITVLQNFLLILENMNKHLTISNADASSFKKKPIGKMSSGQKTQLKAKSTKMGEQSKRILDKLMPLIRFCKDREGASKSTAGHKKSLSVVPKVSGAPPVDSTFTLDKEAPKKPPNNKTVVHSHQKSLAPPQLEIKLDTPTFDENLLKSEEIRVSQQPFIKAKVPPKPTHARTKSDCTKMDNPVLIPKGTAIKTQERARPISAKRVPVENCTGKQIVVKAKPRTQEEIKKKRANTLVDKGVKKEPVVDSVLLSEKNRKGSVSKNTSSHKRSASDGNAVPAKGNPLIREGSLSKPPTKNQHSIRGTPNITSKGFDTNPVPAAIKEKIPTSSYYSLNRPVNTAKRSISTINKRRVKETSASKPSHERSISTQIKINTYLQESGPSKVISITQDTRIEPFTKDSIDVDIVNIAIKRKGSTTSKKTASTEASTKYKQYQKLSNVKVKEDEVTKVGKNYFSKPNKDIIESVAEKYKTNSDSKAQSAAVAKGYQSVTATHETGKQSIPKEKQKVNAPNLSKSVAIRKNVQEKLLQKPIPLTAENLAKMEYAKEVAELTKYIKEYFKEHKEAPPTTANFYRIGKLLGKGAFGKVNLGMHKLTGKMVAIKSINKQYLTDESSKKKVMQEYSILKQMRHPSIIRLHETFESAKRILFVIELCCGGDLLTYVRKRRKLKEEPARCMFHHLIEGLQYCHQKGVLHRDIKLDNILLNATGHIKICDFGVSKVVKPGERLTEQCGTPAYIAPEILKNRGYEGFGVDIWSAGVVLYAMLYGTVPFKANNMKDLHKLITKGKYSLKDGITDEAKDLLRRMLECDPRRRIPIPAIFKHKWMQGDMKAVIFTEEEIEAVMKEYEYTRKEGNIENRTLFTEQNIDSTVNDLTKNITTKSIILAPFNSTKSNISGIDPSVEKILKDKKEVIKFAAKVRDIDRQYEKNNNGEIDNGVYNKLVCASSHNSSRSSSSLLGSELDPYNSSANLNSLASEEESKHLPREEHLPAKGFIGVRKESEVAKEEIIIGNDIGIVKEMQITKLQRRQRGSAIQRNT
eukprot:TRINITY_DN5_c0_g2_i1.p1 TRINITY_DN5_c0_g2~~TRINITY_DN5_c0_g2_i1.p1  ORF type:complete len:1045 (-),score=116.51 TRINITY_DN5_c0_g2_i1:7703-10837(-)